MTTVFDLPFLWLTVDLGRDEHSKPLWVSVSCWYHLLTLVALIESTLDFSGQGSVLCLEGSRHRWYLAQEVGAKQGRTDVQVGSGLVPGRGRADVQLGLEGREGAPAREVASQPPQPASEGNQP